MNRQGKIKAIVMAAMSAIALGVAGGAQALPYALSYNNLTNGTVGFSGPVLPIFPSTINSSASASLGELSVKTGGIGVLNAAKAEIGVDKVDNDMTPVGPGGSYARGDAEIVSQQSQGAPFIQVWNIAEASVDTNTTATASGINGSDTSFVFFTGTGGGALSVDFDVDPYMHIEMPAGLARPSAVRAAFTVTVSITDQLGNVVFLWEPDGRNDGAAGVGGSIGGTEILDPFHLNTKISRDFSDPGRTIYDPTGGGSADVGDLTPSSWASYAVTSNVLPEGFYTLSLLGTESVAVERMSVPEPVSLALLGLGLAGLSIACAGRRSARRAD